MYLFFLRLIKILTILLIFLALFVAFLPSMLSTEWGTRQVVNWINRSIPGKVEIRRMDLNWGKGQIFEGFLLREPEGHAVLEIEKLSSEASLWQLFRKNTQLGYSEIQDLNAAIVTDDEGRTNLQKALGIPLGKNTPPLLASTIILSNINAECYLFSKNRPLTLWVEGTTRQGNLNGSFEFRFTLEGLQASDWQNLKENAEHYLTIEGSKQAQVFARVINFPVDLIDRLAALKVPQLNGLFHSILGDRLNLTVEKQPSLESLTFNVSLSTPLMQGDFQAHVTNEELKLLEPAEFHFNLTPQFVNTFTHHRFELLKPSHLKVIVQSFSVPLNFIDEEIDPRDLVFQSEATLAETAIDIHSVGEIKISHLKANLDALLNEKDIRVKVTGKAQHGQYPFDISFDSYFKKPTNISKFEIGNQTGLSKLNVAHFPVVLLPFIEEYPYLKDEIGPEITAELTFSPLKDAWETTLSFQTPRIVLNDAKFTIGSDLILTSPARLDWSINPNTIKKIFKNDEWTLAEPVVFKFGFKQLIIPLEHPELTKYAIESTVSSIELSEKSSSDIIQAKDFSVKLTGHQATELYIQFGGQLALLNADRSKSSLLRDPLKINHQSFWRLDSDHEIEMPMGQLKIFNSYTDILVNGRMNSEYQFELLDPLSIQYTLDPSTLQHIAKIYKKDLPQLQKPSQLNLKIDPTVIDLNEDPLSSLKFQGTLAVNKIVLEDQSKTYSNLEEINLSWVYDFPMKNFYANIAGSVLNQKNNKLSQLSAYLQFCPDLSSVANNTSSSELRLTCSGLPSSLLSILFQTEDLTPLIGPILDIDIKTFLDPTTKIGYSDILIDSSLFQLNGKFKLNDRISLYDSKKPPIIRFTITPESYQYLKRLSSFNDNRSLLSSVIFSGSLAKFDMPLDFSKLNQLALDFFLESSEIKWASSLSPLILKGRVHTSSLKNGLEFNMSAYSNKTLTIQGQLQNLFNNNQLLNQWDQIRVSFSATGKKLTPSFIQDLLLLKSDDTKKIEALMGHSFDLELAGDLNQSNGSIRLLITGEEGSLDLDGKLVNGDLILNHPFEAQLNITPLFSKTFITPNFKLFSTAISAENPIKLVIDPEGFSLPLFPLQLEKVKIGKGALKLGKIRFRNEGELNSLLGMVRSISDPYLIIWFTPLYFNLNHNILTFDRIDMQVGQKYTLASWGKTNIETKESDIVGGLTAQTLHYAFGIRHLADDFILQIPLYGTNGKLNLDKKKATAKITALLVHTQASKGGKLLGELVNLALPKMDDEVSPPPTTTPFPWEQPQ